jgi:DNA-binding MarR family transcriptional regulator
MHFYESLGFLVFGSRLRRLSEAFLADVNKVYQQHKIKFDAAWFPVFYILSRQEEVSIKHIADQLAISHSAVSQLITSLQARGLIKTTTSKEDGRKKCIAFTPKGRQLLQQVKPVWEALQVAMEELSASSASSKMVLQALHGIEQSMQQESLFNRIEKRLN